MWVFKEHAILIELLFSPQCRHLIAQFSNLMWPCSNDRRSVNFGFSMFKKVFEILDFVLCFILGIFLFLDVLETHQYCHRAYRTF